MIAYDSMLTNTDGAVFPDTEAINVSAPAAGDGTEWIAAWANDHMGARQAVLDHVGLPPNAISEAAGASQFLDALKSFMPAGTVIAWHGQTDMSNFGRWIQLEGQVVLIADYEDLVDACYIGDGNNLDTGFHAYFKTSDAPGSIRDSSGDYFVLPDTRGYILRGYDPSGSVDPEGAFRDFPSTQGGAVEQHYHEVVDDSGVPALGFLELKSFTYTTGAAPVSYYGPSSGPFTGVQTGYDILNAPSSPDETRMSNYQAKFAIRY